jgi:DNA-binding response OmpR family regulator
LTLRDEPSIRKMLALLSHQLGVASEATPDGTFQLKKFARSTFDSILLNLRCSPGSRQQRLPGIRDVRASIVGRVLVITGEIRDQNTAELVDRICVSHVGSWTALRAVVGISESPGLLLNKLS